MMVRPVASIKSTRKRTISMRNGLGWDDAEVVPPEARGYVEKTCRIGAGLGWERVEVSFRLVLGELAVDEAGDSEGIAVFEFVRQEGLRAVLVGDEAGESVDGVCTHGGTTSI